MATLALDLILVVQRRATVVAYQADGGLGALVAFGSGVNVNKKASRPRPLAHGFDHSYTHHVQFSSAPVPAVILKVQLLTVNSSGKTLQVWLVWYSLL